MLWHRSQTLFCSTLLAAAIFTTTGCDTSPEAQRQRDAKTREEVAKATARAKSVIEEAGRKLDQAANVAAHDLKATAEGAHEGWKNGPHSLVNINSASQSDLESLPGISARDARHIIDNRPYATKHDLLAKNAISQADYERIRDRVTAK